MKKLAGGDEGSDSCHQGLLWAKQAQLAENCCSLLPVRVDGEKQLSPSLWPCPVVGPLQNQPELSVPSSGQPLSSPHREALAALAATKTWAPRAREVAAGRLIDAVCFTTNSNWACQNQSQGHDFPSGQ